MALWPAGARCRTHRSDTWPHQPALQRHPKTQWSAVHAGSNSRVRSLLRERLDRAHPARSAYGSFQAHSARTESNSGMRASGRFGLLAKQSRNGRCLGKADGSKRREAAIPSPESGRRNWVDSAPAEAASGTTAVRAIAVIALRARKGPDRPLAKSPFRAPSVKV